MTPRTGLTQRSGLTDLAVDPLAEPRIGPERLDDSRFAHLGKVVIGEPEGPGDGQDGGWRRLSAWLMAEDPPNVRLADLRFKSELADRPAALLQQSGQDSGHFLVGPIAGPTHNWPVSPLGSSRASRMSSDKRVWRRAEDSPPPLDQRIKRTWAPDRSFPHRQVPVRPHLEIETILGRAGRLTSASKRDFRSRHPGHVMLFNACLFDPDGTPLWLGDIDLTTESCRLQEAVNRLGRPLVLPPQQPYRCRVLPSRWRGPTRFTSMRQRHRRAGALRAEPPGPGL
jgi:hypothetical protein